MIFLPPAVRIGLEQAEYSVDERGSVMATVAVIEGTLDQNVVVNVATVEGTAGDVTC